MIVDLSKLPANLASDFTLWRTGEGEAGQWAVIADSTTADGLSTPDDYYVARANALEDNVRFYRVVKGKREQLASANAKVSANQWHTLALKAEGDRFTVCFDGKALLSAQDSTFPGRQGCAVDQSRQCHVLRHDLDHDAQVIE